LERNAVDLCTLLWDKARQDYTINKYDITFMSRNKKFVVMVTVNNNSD